MISLWKIPLSHWYAKEAAENVFNFIFQTSFGHRETQNEKHSIECKRDEKILVIDLKWISLLHSRPQL